MNLIVKDLDLVINGSGDLKNIGVRIDLGSVDYRIRGKRYSTTVTCESKNKL